MPELLYKPKKFNSEHRRIIAYSNQICEEYARDGYDLTLRQLYYRFIALDLFPDDRRWEWTGSRWVRDPDGTKNAEPNYKWLGSIINDARLAGFIDWDYIVDRTREVEIPASWRDPAQIVDAAASGYYIDRWENQPYRVEVHVEKEALEGVVERAAELHRVPTFSCRGYSSQSSMWQAAQRLGGYISKGQIPVILHLGDHDPSGIDMTRDIRDRLVDFIETDYLRDSFPDAPQNEDGEVYIRDIHRHMAESINERHRANDDLFRASQDDMPLIVNRIALNMDQIRDLDPPPSPAKLTDARAQTYIREFGHDSWELDALEPQVLNTLIRDTIESYLDYPLWEETMDRERQERARLQDIARRFRNDEDDVREEEE